MRDFRTGQEDLRVSQGWTCPLSQRDICTDICGRLAVHRPRSVTARAASGYPGVAGGPGEYLCAVDICVVVSQVQSPPSAFLALHAGPSPGSLPPKQGPPLGPADSGAGSSSGVPSWALWGVEQPLWPRPLDARSTPIQVMMTTDVPRHCRVSLGWDGGRIGM